MLRFESPWWLLALTAPVGLWAWRWWRRRRKAGVRFSSVSNARQAGRSWRQRLQWLPTALGDVALILLVFCLARPQAGNERVHDISEGIAIEMVVDRSGSMGQELQYEGKEMTRLEVVKDVFRKGAKQKEKITYIDEKGNRKRIVRYVKQRYVGTEKLIDAITGGGQSRTYHALVWHVVGHWRRLPSGQKTFVRPYWKGAMRSLKRNLDEVERRLVLPEEE